MAVDVFQPFTNPIAGETFRCLSADEEAYVMEWTVRPGGYISFEHLHLQQDEIFHVREGELTLVIAGEEVIAAAGTSVTVPKNKSHRAFNNGKKTVRCVVEYRPGLDYLTLMQCFAGLTLDGDYDAKGAVNIRKMGFFLKHMNCRALSRPTSIPAPIYGLALNAFYVLGLIKGWTKDFARYTGRGK